MIFCFKISKKNVVQFFLQQEQQDLKLTIPVYVSYAKLGHTLCFNGTILVLQRGSSTTEFCKLAKFQSTRIPWRHGLEGAIKIFHKVKPFVDDPSF
jgi:hypothetical protein